MGRCFGFCCFTCGKEGRPNTAPTSQQTPTQPTPTQTHPTPTPTPHQTSQQTPTQPTPTPTPPSLGTVIDQLKAVNDISKLDELIKIVQDILQWRNEEKPMEGRAESSRNVDFIDSGATFFKFLNDHAENSGNKGDIVNVAPRIIGDVLQMVGNAHWVVAGLLVIGYVLKTANQMSENYKRCLDLLQKLVDLWQHVKKLNYCLPNEEEKLKRATLLIVEGCILCASRMASCKLSRFFKAAVNAEDLNSFHEKIKDLQSDLILTTVVQGASIYPQITPAFPVHSVGVADGQEKKVIELLQLTSADTPRMAVVIYGFGGIGETTLAEAAVAKIDLKPYHYTTVDFNIDSSKNDIKGMQEQIVNDLFPSYTLGIEIKLKNCRHGRAVLTDAFKKKENKPIFLFIDNALSEQDLEELLPGDMKELPNGSRILVTTRDLRATDMFIEAGLNRREYVVQPLSNEDAEKFLLQDSADSQRDNIRQEDVEQVLNICKGVPLVLKIVRGHFRKQGYRADKCSQILEALEGGKQIKQEDLGDTLTDFIYNNLEESSQQAFLDICCFFYDMDPSHVEYIVGAQELTSLKEAAFVQMSDDKEKLIVHDIIRERGRTKAESTRITNVESLIDAANQKRLKDIRGVWLVGESTRIMNNSFIRQRLVDENEPECVIEEQDLKAMTELRVLALGKRMRVSHRCEVTLKELRYLRVGGDIPCLPMNLERLPKLAFYAGPLFKNGFSMYQLPKELKVLIAASQSDFNETTYSEESTSRRAAESHSLKYLDLSGLKNLQKVPGGLHLLTSLEILRWNGWHRMEELPKEVCQLTMLTKLTLSDWRSLIRLPAGFGRLTALKDLTIQYCTALKRLPHSFGGLEGLKDLDLNGCEALERLPESFGQLAAVEKLELRECRALQRLPDSFGGLQGLKDLNLKRCRALQCLPDSFGGLQGLKDLNLYECVALERLPESFGQLAAVEILELWGCRALRCLPDSFGGLQGLKDLSLNGCEALERLPESFGDLTSLRYINMVGCPARADLSQFEPSLKHVTIAD